jgi:RNA polymerase sigma-70 factor, ECF subfamily
MFCARILRAVETGRRRTVTAMTAIRTETQGATCTLTDDEVVERVRGGDLALFEVLMRRHNQRLFRAVRSILRDDSEVEDVLQDAYLAAYRNLAGFERRAAFSTWLTRIAMNRALDRRRRHARVVPLDPLAAEIAASDGGQTPSHATENPERQSARREVARVLEDAIDALPDVFRGVYVLRDVEGMNTEETAASLSLEPSTVRTRLHRARALLRERLSPDLDGVALEAFPFGAWRCDRLVTTVLAPLERARREVRRSESLRDLDTVRLPKVVLSRFDRDRLEQLLEKVGPRRNLDALHEEIERAEIVEPEAVPRNVVTMNSVVRFVDEDSDRESEVKLVFPGDADVEVSRISVLAPIGSALLGLSVGDSIDWPLPKGHRRRLRVVAVPYQPEAAGDPI